MEQLIIGICSMRLLHRSIIPKFDILMFYDKQSPLCFPFSDQNFLENHDKPRAAATFAPEVHQAAAVIIFCRRVRCFTQSTEG